MQTTINNNKVIIINGTGGVGKTTFVNLCSQINSKVMNVSMITKAKQIAKYVGYDGGKTEKDRLFLSNLKDLIDAYNDSSIKLVDKFVLSCKNKIIFIDARQPSDIEKLKLKYNATTLLVTNNRIEEIVSNHADADVNNYNYDYYITNDRTIKDLKNTSKLFLDMFTRKYEVQQ